MRKSSFISFALLICFLFSSCSVNKDKWHPELASDHVKPYAKETVELITDYLSFKISYAEAKTEFSEIYRRFKQIGIDRHNLDGNSGDRIVADTMYYIDLFGFSVISNDSQMNEYKDILSFHIGEKTSGFVYESERHFQTDATENYISEICGSETFPFNSAYISFAKETNSWLVDITFDYSNGVLVTDLENYITKIYNYCVPNDDFNLSLSVNYNVYGQKACTILTYYINGDFSCFGCGASAETFDNIHIVIDSVASYVGKT